MTEHTQLIELLNRVFSWKYNSLAAYMLSAKPHIKEGEEELLKLITAIAAKDEEFASSTAKVIEDLQGIARIKPHDPLVSSLNYLSLSYLAGVLKKELEKQSAEYVQIKEQISGCLEAQELLSELKKTSQEQLQKLTQQIS